jgi:hypothetical protein
MLVPPSWDKGIHASALKRIWEEAFAYLKIARHWVFIGTSLPQTDQYLKYLFAIALRHNVYLRQVTIVDSGDAANIQKLFEKSASRVHVEHLPQEMISTLGGEGTSSQLFRKLRCFAPDKGEGLRMVDQIHQHVDLRCSVTAAMASSYLFTVVSDRKVPLGRIKPASGDSKETA